MRLSLLFGWAIYSSLLEVNKWLNQQRKSVMMNVTIGVVFDGDKVGLDSDNWFRFKFPRPAVLPPHPKMPATTLPRDTVTKIYDVFAYVANSLLRDSHFSLLDIASMTIEVDHPGNDEYDVGLAVNVRATNSVNTTHEKCGFWEFPYS